jgi:molybdate-binding protein
VTNEAAADAFGLRFVPIEAHTVEIWLARRWRDHPAANALGEVLASAGFTQRVGQMSGYDLAGCGTQAEVTDPL